MARSAAGTTGVVYLLHFTTPYAHARHYTGWTTDLPARLTAHQAGTGARLLAVIAAHGIGFTLARTWPDTTRTRERALKRQGGASRRCPLCGVTPRRRADHPADSPRVTAAERAQ